MTSGGHNLNNTSKNQLTKFCAFYTEKVNPDQFFSMSVPSSHESVPLVPAGASRGLDVDVVTRTQP